MTKMRNGRSGSRRGWAVIRENLAAQLWPLPATTVAVAVALGIFLPLLDAEVGDSIPSAWQELLFSGGAEAARALLSAIAGSLITATSLVFSLTVVALQLASSQASPRLLRMFAKDRMVHATLALFLGTFAFALTTLRTVEGSADSATTEVPRIAVTVASLSTLASVIMLILFLAHLATQLRVDTMLRDVHRETVETIRRMRSLSDYATDQIPGPRPHRYTHVVDGERSGFITSVSRAHLIAIGSRYDIVIEELHPVGSSVVASTPLARWWPSAPVAELPAAHRDNATHDEDATVHAEIGHAVRAAYSMGFERTSGQDVAFGVRQLVDVACRALSPGVNDPTTAAHAISHLSSVLCTFVRLDEGPSALSDQDGVVRLVSRSRQFPELLSLALEQPRHYGAGDWGVACRLYRLLAEVAYVASSAEHRIAVREQLRRLTSALELRTYDSALRARFTVFERGVEGALVGSEDWLDIAWSADR